MNRIFLEKVHCKLSNARLSKFFWAETLAYACHLVNRLPSSVIRCKTPLEVWLESCLGLWLALGIWLSDLLSCQERQIGSESEEKSVHRIQERSKRLQSLGSKGHKVYLEQGYHIRWGFNGEAYGLSAGGEWEDRQDIVVGGEWCYSTISR